MDGNREEHPEFLATVPKEDSCRLWCWTLLVGVARRQRCLIITVVDRHAQVACATVAGIGPRAYPCTVPELDHGDPGSAPSAPPPLVSVGEVPRRSPAEEARTLVAGTNQGTLATLTVDGDPWASFVTYGTLDDGSPVLCVSRLAEHGRNLDADPRASLAIVQPDPPADPLASARVTLAGVARRPEGRALAAARDAHLASVPGARHYVDYTDFSLWILDVHRVRWVGGYGRMDSADGASFGAAAPDPIAAVARSAVAHLNADHADALMIMARALGGHPDATAATCTAADRFGLDLSVDTPRGRATSRIGYAAPLRAADGLRAATVELARRARSSAPPSSSRKRP